MSDPGDTVSPMVTTSAPLCVHCIHRDYTNPEAPTCAAFPSGIPQPILENAADHRFPYRGDGGTVYEWDPDTPPISDALLDFLFS